MSGLRQHGSATVDELRAFLQGMRGKSAQEVLGTIAESGLMRAIIQATVLSVIGIGVFTVGPYLIYGSAGRVSPASPGGTAPKGATPEGTAAATSSAAGAVPAAGATPNGGSVPASEGTAGTPGAGDVTGPDGATGGAGSATDLERAAKVLGVSETKSADPKSNPREKDLDSLLDKIK